MKIELLKLGAEDEPHIKLLSETTADAVALGGLAEKCNNRGIHYSSNVGALADDTSASPAKRQPTISKCNACKIYKPRLMLVAVGKLKSKPKPLLAS